MFGMVGMGNLGSNDAKPESANGWATFIMRHIIEMFPGIRFCVVSIVLALGATLTTPVTAAQVFPKGSPWKYFKGISEASAPDNTAWRGINFNDSGWLSGAGAFFYENGTGYAGGTELTDMFGGYSTLYLRKTFVVNNPGNVSSLTIDLDSDDGCVVWINGIEVDRVNAPAGEIPFNGTAPGPLGEPNTSVTIINDPAAILQAGTNVVAVQALNASLGGSSDFLFDLAMTSTEPDPFPPEIASFTPASGTLNSLTQVEVTFTEPVQGVTAGALLVNGQPAVSVVGTAATYIFSFPQPPFGPVTISFSPSQSIVDFGVPPNPFDHTDALATWQYILVDNIPPMISSTAPAMNTAVTELSQIEVRFSESVSGVDAADLVIGGVPATNLVALSGSTYLFQFAQPPDGNVVVAWAAGHGITDQAANGFGGGSWFYELDPNAKPSLLISEFMASNIDTLRDEDGESNDWIEIHNDGAVPVNLAGWYLTDKSENLTKWQFPATNLNAGAYLVVFASEKNRRVPGLPLHTNFKLSDGGEYLALVQPDGTNVVSEFAPVFPPQITDTSYGWARGAGQTELLLDAGAPATAMVPTDDSLGLSWTDVGFDDSGWSNGVMAVGYDRLTIGVDFRPLIGFDVDAMMYPDKGSLYVRVPFAVDNPDAITGLTMDLQFEDGFIGYINGEEIARSNAPVEATFSSVATAPRTDTAATNFTHFEISFARAFLNVGTNILAFHMLNNLSPTFNQDLLLQPKLNGLTSLGPLVQNYFPEPTPGAPNSPGVRTLGPIFSEVQHSPAQPGDNDDIVVTARLRDAFAPVASAQLHYRVMFGGEFTLPLLDDGAHGDGLAGDGIHGAIIPAGLSQPGQMVRWYVTATDDTGTNTSRFPTHVRQESAEYLGTVVQHPSLMNSLPVFHWFVQDTAAADTRSGTRASVYWDGQFYDNAFNRVRGATAPRFIKKPYKFDFNPGDRFRMIPGQPRMDELNLNATYHDKAYVRTPLSYETYRLAGSPACDAFNVRVQRNGLFYSVAVFNEQVDETFLERRGFDPRGAMYKMNNGLTSSTAGVRKQTRRNENNSDLQEIVAGLRPSNPHRGLFVMDHFDMPALINYLAAGVIIQDMDRTFKNYYLYRDTEGTGLWHIFPWDKDLTFGLFGLESDCLSGSDDSLPYNGCMGGRISHPLFGSEGRAYNSGVNMVFDTIINTPVTREMFLRRMRTFMDEFLQPPGTPASQRFYEQRMDELKALLMADAALDFGRWNGGFGLAHDITTAMNRMKIEYFDDRRVHLYQTHHVDNIGNYPDVAGIPHAQASHPTITFGTIEVNPSSGNQNEEFVELINPNPIAVDISGWRIEGGVEMDLPPGTVLPALGSIHLSPDTVAFRNRATSPRGGEGRLVVGPYRGQLSARGETLRLLDATGRLLRTHAYPANPSLAQQFLRVTEIMYHPAPTPGLPLDSDVYEFVELKNISTNVTLNLNGVRFVNGIEFNFSQGTITTLPPGARAVVVRSLVNFATRHSTDNVAGQYTGALDNRGERIVLVDATGEEILDFDYNDNWHPITDGHGFSLVVVDELAKPDLWTRREQWQAGGRLHGNPGSADPPAPFIPPLLITEVLARTDVPPPLDSIELFNPNDEPAQAGGWFITDDFRTPKKYRIPDGTTIPAGGTLVLDEADFNAGGLGFAFSSLDDEAYLFSGDAQTNLTGYVHGFDFGSSADGVSFGRHVISTGREDFVAQERPTLGASNAPPGVGPLVISEVMYHPNASTEALVDDPLLVLLGLKNPASRVFDVEDSLEYVELQNISANPVALFDPAFPTNRWRLSGAVDFQFPSNQSLAPGEVVLVVDFDPLLDQEATQRFRTFYNVDPGAVILGPWNGQLNNKGERIKLDRPDAPNQGVIPRILVEEVDYQDEIPWPPAADGTGSSLQRLVLTDYGNDPTNWFASGRSPGTANVFNLAPAISLISPTNGTVLGQGETIVLSANAIDTDGQITSVQFFSGNILVGEVNAAPFDFVWTNAAAGTHVLTARATDDRFATTDSEAVMITLELFAPSVVITSPSDGAELLGDSVPILISATDVDGFITLAEFFNGTSKLGEVAAPPFTFNWTNLTFGSHTLWVTVKDNSGNQAFSPAITVTIAGGFNTNRTLIAAGSDWKYFDQGIDLGTNWQNPGFDDSTWPEGPAQLGYGDGDEATVVSFGPDPNNKFSTTYFRKTFHLSDVAAATASNLEILRDDGALVYLNGAEVYRNGLPDGPVTFSTFSNIEVIGEPAESMFHPAPVDPAFLVEGDNTVAVEIHQRSLDSSDISFDFKLEAVQSFLAPTLVSQPVSQTAREGGAVSYSVMAEGSQPLYYQWLFNGAKLPEENGPQLILDNVQLEQGGNYSVWVTNVAGSVLSDIAALVVVSDDYAGAVLSDLPVHYYRFEETSTVQPAADEGIPGGAPGTYRGGILVAQPSATPALGSAIELNGASGTLVDLGLFHIGDEVTLETWVRVDPDARMPWNAVAGRWDGSYEIANHSGSGISFALRNMGGTLINPFGPVVPLRGEWHHVVGVFGGGAALVYVNGVPGSPVSYTGVLQDAGPTPDRVMIGATRDGTGSAAFNLKGAIDEVAFYDYPLPPERILAHYQSAFAPPAPPALTINPGGEISWPSESAGFTLQFTDDLGPAANWLPPPDMPLEEGGYFKVTVPLGGPSRFYRLFKP